VLLHSLLLKRPNNSRGASWIRSLSSKAVLWPSSRRAAWAIKTLREANHQGVAARQAVSPAVSLHRSRCSNRSAVPLITRRARKILIIKTGCPMRLRRFSRRTPRCRIRAPLSASSLNQVIPPRETYHKSRVIQHKETRLRLLLSRRKLSLRAPQVPTTKCRKPGTQTIKKLPSSWICSWKTPTVDCHSATLPRKL
jgi:hypothetical protein